MEIIISLLSGALGGNLAGGLLKKFSMRIPWNSIIGVLEGGIGGYILSALDANFGSGAMDLSGILEMVVEGGVGGFFILLKI